MLTPTEFNDRYSDDELEDKLLDRPIATVRDIQYLYGQLYTLGTAGSSKYAQYLTPNDATELFEESNSLLAVKVDLSGDTPQVDPETPVEIREYNETLVDRVALASYPNKGRGIEHSVTHKTGANKTRTDMISYAEGRLQRWPTADGVTDLVDDHEDGWIIEALQSLGKDKQSLRAIGEHIYRNFDDKRRSLVTVRIKLDSDGDYLWPGEIDVIGEGLKRLYESRLISKNEATDAEGEAADMVTDEITTVAGTTPDPLNFYLTRQTEKYPNFDPNESWRVHSVGKETAVAITNAETFINACSYREFNGIIYYLPYVTGEMDANGARILYKLLYRTANTSDLTPIEEAYNQIKESGKQPHETGLRFYVALINKQQASLYDVYRQEMEVTLHHPSEIATAHESILQSWAYTAKSETTQEVSGPLPAHDSWSLLSTHNLLNKIVTGGYFFESMVGDLSKVTAMGGKDPLDDTAIPNDDRVDTFFATLTGSKVAVETLLKNYIGRLENNPSDQFPTMQAAGQFAQLSALATAGRLVSHSTETELLTIPPDYTNSKMDSGKEETSSDTNTDEEMTKKQLRKEKLAKFLEETPAFENNERRAAFLVGVLVGQVSVFQRVAENLSQTLLEEYPINSITQRRIKQITTKAIDRNLIYSQRNNYGSVMYEEVVEELLETLTTSNPDTWTISSSDIKFNYALGVSYGQNNQVTEDNTDAESPEETEPAA